jgi:hypothetical protein
MTGVLVQTTAGTWIERAPTHCPMGHRLGPNRVRAGHTACAGHGGGHPTWTCRTCDQTVYGLPLGPHCSVVTGPASVRISTSPAPEQSLEPPTQPVLYPALGELDQTAATVGGQRP